LNLYAYVHIDREEHFFIQKDDKPITELGYRKILLATQTGKVVRELKTFVSQLQTETFDCPNIQEKIENVEYKRESLKRIVSKYNDFKHKNVYVKPKDKKEMAFYGRLGMNKNYSSYVLRDRYIRGIDSYNAGKISPVFALGVDLGVSRNRNKLGFVFEVLYKTVNYSFTDERNGGTFTLLDEYQFDMKFLQFNTFLRYSIRVGKVQPYIKAGVGLASIGTRKNYAIETSSITKQSVIYPIFTQRIELNTNLNVGVKMNRIFLETGLSIGSNIGYYDSNVGLLKSDYFSLVVGYNFWVINK
jgi:hypothetical protein